MCLHSNIILNQIPVRGSDPKILEHIIAKINTYLNNRGKRGDNVFFNNRQATLEDGPGAFQCERQVFFCTQVV